MTLALTDRLNGHSGATPLSRVGLLALLAVFTAYGAAEILLYIVHEPWRDEAQAWLWAQELDSLPDLLVVPGEGHPPLWYWILKLIGSVFAFDSARPLTLALAIFNAGLLAPLVANRPITYATILFSEGLLHYWGFHFRPYGLIFTLILVALHLERKGRPVPATWAMALTCGFHFFAGFLFGFWLLVQALRGVKLRDLAGPAALGLVFGVLIVLSGWTNSDAEFNYPVFDPAGPFEVFAMPFTLANTPFWLTGGFVCLAMAYALRKDPVTLGMFALVAAGFSIFSYFIYGSAGWHTVFLVVLVFLAFMLARPRPASWALPVILAPTVLSGANLALIDIRFPYSSAEPVFLALRDDAGGQLVPSENLVAWPDFTLTTMATRYGFDYVSGNTGDVIGPVAWHTRRDLDIDIALFGEIETPYWLFCRACRYPLAAVSLNGRHAVEVHPGLQGYIEKFYAFRIEDGPGTLPLRVDEPDYARLNPGYVPKAWDLENGE